MSARVTLGGKVYFLGDEELFVRIAEIGYDPAYEIVTYEIRTIWTDDTGAWQETCRLQVSLEYQPEQAACLAGFTPELQPARLMYAVDPDTVSRPVVAAATLIGGDETRFVLYRK